MNNTYRPCSLPEIPDILIDLHNHIISVDIAWEKITKLLMLEKKKQLDLIERIVFYDPNLSDAIKKTRRGKNG